MPQAAVEPHRDELLVKLGRGWSCQWPALGTSGGRALRLTLYVRGALDGAREVEDEARAGLVELLEAGDALQLLEDGDRGLRPSERLAGHLAQVGRQALVTRPQLRVADREGGLVVQGML